MNTQTETTAISVLCDGTIKAAILHLRERGIDPSLVDDDDIEQICTDLRAELKLHIPEIMSEWKAALDTHMGEAFLRNMMNIQCNHAALKALQAGGWIK